MQLEALKRLYKGETIDKNCSLVTGEEADLNSSSFVQRNARKNHLLKKKL